MIGNIFIELTLLLIITIIVSGLARLLKQPLIIGYIITGVIVSSFFLNIVKFNDAISTFAQMGVVFLLFMVGLNLNPKLIKDVGKVSLITGIGQVVFTSLVGFFICKLLGFSNIVSIYIAVALTFSSTIIIIKLLSDKKDLETLYGKISIGLLLVQDFIAIIILILLSSIPSESSLIKSILEFIIKGACIFIILFIASKYALPKFTKIIAKSQEFLLLFSISWCFAIATFFYYLNFSVEAGALLAGITLSLSPYHFEISSKMKSLRDFFIILFFILLGSQIRFENLTHYITPIIVLSLFILIGNPLIVIVLMGILGYTKRNSFMVGLIMAQISEFSLVLIALGVKLGHLTNEILSLVTVIGLITIAGSSYMILYSNKIYPYLSNYLKIFEKKGKKTDEYKYHKELEYDIILVGYNRIGFDILESIKKLGKSFMIVDYDPEVIRKLANEGYNCRYGDANDSEMLEELNLSKAKMVISTIPFIDTNLLLINKVKNANKNCIILVVSHQIDEAMDLYNAGATYVIMPHFLGGRHASILIEKHKLDMNKFLKEKLVHVEHLKERKMVGHEHPVHERS